MPPPLRNRPAMLWHLDVNTPFPEELEIFYDGEKHGVITPRSRVTRQTLEKVNVHHLY